MWYQQADNDEISAYNIGVIYSEKIKDYKKAISYYKKAFSLGIDKSALNLGNVYQDLKDYSSADLWYKKAIENENITALKNIGLLYHNNLKSDLYACVYYIALINTEYQKNEILTFSQKEWKIPNETIKKGYELQLKMKELPRRYIGDLGL